MAFLFNLNRQYSHSDVQHLSSQLQQYPFPFLKNIILSHLYAVKILLMLCYFDHFSSLCILLLAPFLCLPCRVCHHTFDTEVLTSSHHNIYWPPSPLLIFEKIFFRLSALLTFYFVVLCFVKNHLMVPAQALLFYEISNIDSIFSLTITLSVLVLKSYSTVSLRCLFVCIQEDINFHLDCYPSLLMLFTATHTALSSGLWLLGVTMPR